MGMHLQENWAYGNKFCKIAMSMDQVHQLTSALCMIAVSVDRAVLIYLQRPLNTRQAWTVCIIIWLLSYLMTIPTFLDTRVRSPQKCKTVNNANETVTEAELLTGKETCWNN